MLIKWTDEFKTNVPEIDEQHREIIHQLNLLHESISKGQGNDRALIILKFLKEYSKNHFQFEEGCMESHQCPFAKINQKEHEVFIDKLKRIESDFSNNEVDASMVLNIYRELKNWVESHILRVDTKLRQCVSPNECKKK